MKKFTKWITEHSLVVVTLALFLLIPTIYGYYKTKINYDILVYLPEDVETIQGENILTNDFGIGAFSFVTVDGMHNKDILALEHEIKKIEGVNQVLSVADLTDTVLPKEMIPEDILEKVYQEDKTVIAITFTGSTSEQKTIDAVESLREVVKDANHVSGMTAMVLDTMELSEKEIMAYIGIAVLLCVIVLLFATDSYLVPLFLLGNIGIAILYNLGSNIFLGEISYITKAITAVLQLGVTMDFSIFLYHKYEEEKIIESDSKKAMQQAIHKTFVSVVGSSLTTIAGFLALCSMNLTLGSDIGIVMAKGVVCGLICVLTLFPALLLVFEKGIEKTKHKNIFPKFKSIQNFSRKHYKLTLIVFLLLLLPAIYGNSHYNVYYKLDESLPETLPSRVANNTLASDFNIVSPEMILIDKHLSSSAKQEMIEKLENIKGIDFVLAPSNILASGIPKEMLPVELAKLLENDTYQLILLNSTYEIASDELNNQIAEVTDLVKSYDEKAIIAGEGPLMKDLTTIADHDFKMVNYASIGVIFVLMLFVLKSFSLPFLLICTIEFAILANMAVAYFTNASLPFIASIVVGTIQLGATIDYAILMSTKYLEERTKEKNKNNAIKNTLEATVPSIITSALCFFGATFGVAIYSKIDMIGSICNLLSRGSMISMGVVIFLLPALLLTFDKIIMKTTKIKKEGL